MNLFRILSKLTIHTVVENVDLPTIPCMLDVQILRLTQPLQPLDGDHALALALTVASVRNNAYGVGLEESLTEDEHASAGNRHSRHEGVDAVFLET